MQITDSFIAIAWLSFVLFDEKIDMLQGAFPLQHVHVLS